MSPLKVGLIGCGNVVSYGHRPALTSLPDVELAALADVTEARRKIGQEWFGLAEANLYADYRDLLARTDIEAVCVTVPQQYRREIVLAAIEAGKHVLSEKPLSDTPAVAAELIAAAEAHGVIYGMVHNYVYFPEYHQIKGLIEGGVIGDLRLLTMQYMGVIDYPGAKDFKPDWRHTMAGGGGVLTDMIHAVYLTEWLFGAPAQQVMAFVDAPEYAHRQPVVEDLALVQIAFPTGYATIHMGWGEGVGGVDVTGSDGHIRLRYNQYQTSGFNQPIELYSVRDWVRTDHPLANLPTHLDNTGRSFSRIWADFRDAIREQRPTIMPARAGQRALEITLAAYLSGVTGQVITLPLPADHPVYQRGIHGLSDVTAWPHSRTQAAGLFGLRGR